MAKACDAVAAALRAELLAGRLSGRLPGMRELARRQGVSTFIVFQAHHASLARLLRDGVPSVVLSVVPGDLRGQIGGG